MLRGGRVSIAGCSAVRFCAGLTPDGGQAWLRATNRSAGGDADTSTCVTHLNPFGCRNLMTKDGVAGRAICVG